MLDQLPQFLPAFFRGLATNFGIAIWCVAGGLLLGLPLALARLAGGLMARAASALIAFFRAAPTFVVMFFLVNVVPSVTPWLAVVLSLTVYGVAYVSDNAMEPIRQLRNGSPALALLFVMSVVRAFFVMVLASGFGAAVGVVEATTVTLRAIEAMPRIGDRLLLIGLVMLLFTVGFQAIYRCIDWGRQRLQRRLHSSGIRA